MRPIDDTIHTWIAENLVSGGSVEELVAALVASDVSPADARAAVETANTHPYIYVAMALNTQLKKRDSLLNTLDQYQRLDPAYLTLTPTELPSFADFTRDYLSKNRPGLFRHAVDHWPAMQWTPQVLVDKVGANTIVEIQQGRDTNTQYEIEGVYHKRNARFGDFMATVEHADTNDVYLTANNSAMLNGPFKSLVHDAGTLGDGYLLQEGLGERMFLWIGPKGTITPLHHDKTHNIFVQVYGKKRFRLIPAINVPYMYNHFGVFTHIDLLNPDAAKFPLYARAGIIDITIGPGDFLFIPIGWWHHVVAETASISLSFTNLPTHNQFFDYPTKG